MGGADSTRVSRMEQQRRDETAKLWFRSERFFRCNELWYFHTREGLAVGPYKTRTAAEVDSALLIEQLKVTPKEEAIAVIRDFIMGMGGELDYVNDPAFTAYVVSEEEGDFSQYRV